jgi:hypothetical protein
MMESQHRSILLADYMSQVEPTDRLPASDLQPILLGLFGEVGSIMATAKKLHREKEVYVGYRNAVEEEFGDALWYFTALCRRLNLRMDGILAEAASGEDYSTQIAANDLVSGRISRISGGRPASSPPYLCKGVPSGSQGGWRSFCRSRAQEHRQDEGPFRGSGLREFARFR